MKVIEAITQIDSLKPNTYSLDQKLYWLSKVESMVKRLVIDAHEGGEQIPFDGYKCTASKASDLNCKCWVSDCRSE